MKTRTALSISFLWIFSSLAAIAAQTPSPDFDALGRAFVLELSQKQFDKAVARFDAPMVQALPAPKVAETWTGLLGKVGEFKSIKETRVEAIQRYHRVHVICDFEKSPLDVQVVFNSDGKVSGLHFAPVTAAWSAPAYADLKSFQERTVSIHDGKWELPGTLTVPVKSGRYPAVVLVHGSGPNDEDETILGNKPFKDLAWGLASQGIVVLRYEKRTRIYGAKFGDDPDKVTVKEETIDDAQAAVAIAAQQPEVDPKHVYVIGHSLGGMLGPRIAENDPQIAGLILMAGTTRPLEQVIVEQIHYLTSLPDVTPEDAKKQIADAEDSARQIESPSLKVGMHVKVLGADTPASYWLDLRDYHPGETAAKLTIPILVLQGGRDYQVRTADFEGWQKALAGRANVTLKLYPALNHLFAEGTGPSTPQEYDKPSHVSAEVIKDIASWIQAGGTFK
ncbi:MAG: alpha/beta hydrolase [Candidatus Acidiferrales bacterium]